MNQTYKSCELFLNPDTLFVLGVHYYTFAIVSGYNVLKRAIM